MSKLTNINGADAAEIGAFDFPPLLLAEGEEVLHEEIQQVDQTCCCGFVTVPKCCSTGVFRRRITCTNFRLLIGVFAREDRCCCCWCGCAERAR